MALDELVATIEKIQQRIKDHRTSLAANETRTRQVLIDPLLAALGWDVSDPDQVELEYDVRGRRADYALLQNQKPVAVIEAKRLGKQLIDDSTMQAVNYANTAGIDYMVVTNGDEWNMYSVFERGAIEDRVVMTLSITSERSYVNALKSLSLWHANLDAGAVLVEASEPVLTPQEHQKQTQRPSDENPVKHIDSDQRADDEWISLYDLVRERGKLQRFGGRRTKPTSMEFPNFPTKEIKVWRDVWITWAEWLSQEFNDTAKWESINESLPERIATLSKRIRRDASGFRGAGFRLPNGWFIDAGLGSQGDMWRAIEYSAEHFDVDHSQIRCRFD